MSLQPLLALQKCCESHSTAGVEWGKNTRHQVDAFGRVWDRTSSGDTNVNQAKRRLSFWMTAGLLALGGVSTAGCRAGTSTAPRAPVGAVGGALVPGTGLPWPPPNLLLFIGYHNSLGIEDFAADSEFVYATMSGGRTHIVNGVLQGDVASWIARIPLDALK
ncbi:MAG: hypothetical protein SFV15_15425 [Polyangiaceae bacterium]|nr:hypothetical protein [Polyangiaceae bacterium]